MLRAVVLAARLEFTIDDPILDSIDAQKHEIARSAPARLLEEYFKILRSGHAEEAFRQLHATGLLKEITPELDAAPDYLWRSISSLDRYRANFEAAPETLTNAILAGTPAPAARPGRPAPAILRRSAGAAGRARPVADSTPRCRAAAADHQLAASPHGHPGAIPRPTRPAASLDVRRSGDLARDSRRAARRGRALAPAAGGDRTERPASPRAGRAGHGRRAVSASPPPPPPSAQSLRAPQE